MNGGRAVPATNSPRKPRSDPPSACFDLISLCVCVWFLYKILWFLILCVCCSTVIKHNFWSICASMIVMVLMNFLFTVPLPTCWKPSASTEPPVTDFGREMWVHLEMIFVGMWMAQGLLMNHGTWLNVLDVFDIAEGLLTFDVWARPKIPMEALFLFPPSMILSSSVQFPFLGMMGSCVHGFPTFSHGRMFVEQLCRLVMPSLVHPSSGCLS
jgi:hypothetical protein